MVKGPSSWFPTNWDWGHTNERREDREPWGCIDQLAQQPFERKLSKSLVQEPAATCKWKRIGAHKTKRWEGEIQWERRICVHVLSVKEIAYITLYFEYCIPSTFTSMSSRRPPAWLMTSEFGRCTGPGPPSDTCGPDMPPLMFTKIGHPGTGILLNETLMMCSQGSAGTNETANLIT